MSQRQPVIGRKTSWKSSPWVARCDAACSASFAFVNLFLLTLLTEVLENDPNCRYRWWEHIHQPRHWGPGWSSSSPCTAWTERSDSSTTLFSTWSVNKTTFIFWFASIRQKAGYIGHAVSFTKELFKQINHWKQNQQGPIPKGLGSECKARET